MTAGSHGRRHHRASHGGSQARQALTACQGTARPSKREPSPRNQGLSPLIRGGTPWPVVAMKRSTKDQIDGNWKQMKGRIKQAWGDLTDDDLQRAEGEADELVGIIQERSGEEREKIEARLDKMADDRS